MERRPGWFLRRREEGGFVESGGEIGVLEGKQSVEFAGGEVVGRPRLGFFRGGTSSKGGKTGGDFKRGGGSRGDFERRGGSGRGFEGGGGSRRGLDGWVGIERLL